MSETEVRFNAVERLLQYQGKLSKEAARLCDGDPKEESGQQKARLNLNRIVCDTDRVRFGLETNFLHYSRR